MSLFLIVGCQEARGKQATRSQKQTQNCQNQNSCCCATCIVDCSDEFTQSCRTGNYTKR